MRSNSFAALGSADAAASPSSTAAPLDAQEGSPPRAGGGFGGEAIAPASASATSARRRRRSRAASTPAEDNQAKNDLLDASSLSFRFASECEAGNTTTALGGGGSSANNNRLLKTTSIDRALGIEANAVERSSESAGSLSASLSAGGIGIGSARTSSGVLSDGGSGGQQAGSRQPQQRTMIPSLPTIAASPLGPSSTSLRPRSSPTKDRGGGGGGSATATAAAAASAQNPFDGFVTPRGSPWAPAPLEAAEGSGGGARAAAAAAAPVSARSSGGNGNAAAPANHTTPRGTSTSSFRSYLHGELHPTPSLPTADVAWGQTERQRVYNALLAVPAHLERLLLLGGLVCADAWLAALTLLPLRLGMALVRGLRWAFTRGARRGGGGGRGGKWRARRGGDEVDDTEEEEEREQREQSASSKNAPSSNPGALLYDLLCFLIFSAAALTCCAVPVGALYFWMKDMTQEFLKLHVIYTAVDILDKIACSFSVDALDALAGTCALIAAPKPACPAPNAAAAAASAGSGEAADAPPSSSRSRPRSSAAAAPASSSPHPSSSHRSSRLSLVPHLVADALVAGAIVTAHAFVLLAHGVALSVAMHSKRGSTLLALTFASNFVEIKSAVFKRYDGRKLYTLACQDCVERFHLLAALAFVLVEAAAAGKGGGGSAAEPSHSSPSSSSYSFWSRPDALLLARCGHVFAAEVAIDVAKHAVLSKFNEVRPGMYREFARDVASAAADGRRGHSHALYRRLLFDPLAPAALAVRMLVTAARARRRQAAAAAVAAANAAGGAEALGEAVVVAAAGVGRVLSALSLTVSAALSAASSAAAWMALWVCALGVKVALGFGLRVGCAAYLKHYDRRHGGLKRE